MMNISLPPQLEAYVRQQVESGLFGNASEVIRHALREQQEERELFLQALLGEALAQADRGELHDIDLDKEFDKAVKKNQRCNAKKTKKN